MKPRGVLLVAMAVLALAGCESSALSEATASGVETRDSAGTLVKPAAPFANDLSQLILSQPRNGSKVTGPIAFTFDTQNLPQGMVLLFKNDPGVLVNGRLASGWSNSGCLGGIVSMAGMTWNGSLRLDSQILTTGFHACGATEHEPIDPSRPITLADLPAGKIYWVVVGYDSRLFAVATSPVYFFTWSPS